MSLKIEGTDKLMRLLNGMGSKTVTNRVVRKSINKGASVVKKEMKQEADRAWKQAVGKSSFTRNGTVFKVSDLKKEIIHKIRRGTSLYAVIGPKVGNRTFAHWLEFGTLAKRTEPLSKGRSAKAQAMANRGMGLVKGPFMRPAFNKSKRRAGLVLRNTMAEAIVTEANKLKV